MFPTKPACVRRLLRNVRRNLALDDLLNVDLNIYLNLYAVGHPAAELMTLLKTLNLKNVAIRASTSE